MLPKMQLSRLKLTARQWRKYGNQSRLSSFENSNTNVYWLINYGRQW